MLAAKGKDLSQGVDWAGVVSPKQRLGAVEIRSTDRRVQEDARLLSFDGSAWAAVFLGSNFPRDLRAYPEAKATLTLDIKALSGSGPLELGLGCGDNCRSSVDIRPLLKTPNQWQTLRVDLACLNKNGFDFGRVQQSFVLSSSAAAHVEVSDIRFEPGQAATADLKCPQ